MLFCSDTMNSSIRHTSLMLHHKSPLTSSAEFPPEIGLENPCLKLPVINLLFCKLFTAIVRGNVGRDGINVNIEFTTSWVSFVKPFLVSYALKRCKVMGYCSSVVDAKDTVHE